MTAADPAGRPAQRPTAPHSAPDGPDGRWMTHPRDACAVWAAVADVTGVTVHEMRTRPRRRTVSRARQVAVWLLTRHSWWSAAEIAGMVAAPDDADPHSQVIHAVARVDRALAAGDAAYTGLVAAVGSAVAARSAGAEDR